MRYSYYRVIAFLALVVLLLVGSAGLGAAVPPAGTRVVVVPPPGSSCRVSILGPQGALETLEFSQAREMSFPVTAQLGVLVEVVGGATQAELTIHTTPQNPGLGRGAIASAKGVRLVGSVYGGEAHIFTIAADKEPPRRAT